MQPTALLAVTVTSGARRVDLVLPGTLPVAELVPELARSVGMLDVATVHGGCRIVTADGRELAAGLGLAPQGVVDGGVLCVAAGSDRPVPRVYDDVVEAMADAVEHDLRPWTPAAGRRTALVAAGSALALGLVALLTQRAESLAGAAAVAAAVVAGVLVLGGIVVSRTRGETEAGVTLAWAGTAYAAGAGVLSVPGPALLGLPLAAAGAGAALAGTVALAGLDRGRVLALPGAVAGAAALLAGLLAHLTLLGAAVVLMTVLALAVAAGSVLPTMALGLTGTGVDLLREPAAIDHDAVRRDARLAHEILVALTASVGLLLVLVAPLAVSQGLPGALLVVDATVVVALRARHHRAGAEVLVGLASGLLSAAAISTSVLVLHPAWRPALAVALVTGGSLVLLGTLVPVRHTLRRGRAGDVLETAGLLLLVPLAVLASGLLERISGLTAEGWTP